MRFSAEIASAEY